MSPFPLALLSLPLLISSAAAESVGGGKGGGGRGGGALSKVSAGIGSASGSGGGNGGGSSSYTGYLVDEEVRGCYDRHGRFFEREHAHYNSIECRASVTYNGSVVRHRVAPPPSNLVSKLHFYAGAQKV